MVRRCGCAQRATTGVVGHVLSHGGEGIGHGIGRCVVNGTPGHGQKAGRQVQTPRKKQFFIGADGQHGLALIRYQQGGIGALQSAIMPGQCALQIALGGFLDVDHRNLPVEGIAQGHDLAHDFILGSHHKQVIGAFLLPVTDLHHIQRDVVNVDVDHIPDLKAGRGTQFFGRNGWGVNLQQLVLLGAQHDVPHQTLEPQPLQAAHKVFHAGRALTLHTHLLDRKQALRTGLCS